MAARWRYLEANADREDVQEEINWEIRRGTIRVVPAPGGRIRIIPLHSEPLGQPESNGPQERPRPRTPRRPSLP